MVHGIRYNNLTNKQSQLIHGWHTVYIEVKNATMGIKKVKFTEIFPKLNPREYYLQTYVVHQSYFGSIYQDVFISYRYDNALSEFQIAYFCNSGTSDTWTIPYEIDFTAAPI